MIQPKSLLLMFPAVLLIPAAWAQAPTGLKVVSATRTQTQLSWSGSASSYTVQRAQVGGTFGTIATVATPSYTDATVDPYVQLNYQVLAGSPAAASNQVTVGPPPAGVSLAAQAPLIGSDPSQTYGENISLALDANGDPSVAFLWVDPLGNGDSTTTKLLFRSWNRAAASWNPLVTIGVVGDVSSNSRAPLSLAYDASTKTWAVATSDFAGAMRVYSSPDGVVWTLKKTYSTVNDAWIGPSLALANGNLYLSADREEDTVQYITGKLSDVTTWTVKAAPSVATIDRARPGVGTALALDSAGNPAIAYWNDDLKNGYNAILLYWKPATTTAPVVVMDSQNQQSDNTEVRLTFAGLNPRIVVYVARIADAAAGLGVHFVRSDDAGATWKAPVTITPDGHSTTDYPFDLAFDSQGHGLIAFGQNGGSGDQKCGSPEQARSSDLVTWTTCSPVATFGDFGSYPGGIQAAFQGNDKTWLFWWNAGETQADTGVVMYREPPADQITGPVILNVLDAESAQTTMVPGQWVAIYGANMSTVSRAWGGDDFVGSNLPTKLSGVSVSFNGLPAAVYYISPAQIDAQVPSGVSGSVPVTVSNNGAVSGTFLANVVANSPTLYIYPGGTKVYAAAQHVVGGSLSLIGDPAVIGTAGSKALAGEAIILYVNGLAASPAGVFVSATAYSNPVTVTFASLLTATTVAASYAGLSFPGGFQVNVNVPSGLKAGDYNVTVTTQGQTSQAGVTLPVGP